MRPSKKDKVVKTATLKISVWWNSEDGKIHLSSKDPKFILTVGDNPEKKRGHPKLFRELTKVLKNAGVPAPEEEPSKSN